MKARRIAREEGEARFVAGQEEDSGRKGASESGEGDVSSPAAAPLMRRGGGGPGPWNV